LLIAGFLLAAAGLAQIFSNSSSILVEYPLYALGLILLSIGGMLIPFIVHKFHSMEISGRPPAVENQPSTPRTQVLIPIMAALWAGCLLGGYFLIDQGLVASLITPLFAILAILLPVGTYLLIIGGGNGPLDRSRSWGALSSGLTLAPLLGIALEFGLLLVAFAFIMIFLMQDSSLLRDLELTAARLSSGQQNPEILKNMLVSFIGRPSNRYLIFSIIAGLVPIIEEVVKQLPLWLLAGRKLTPRAGLMIGALGGAGFAITESLLSVSTLGGSEQWFYQIIGRAGAGLMHLVTGAIGGWGLASAIGGRRYIRAALAYLTSVIIHGVWNAMAIWDGLERVTGSPSINNYRYSNNSLMPLGIMGVLFVIMFFLLLYNKTIIKD
jgi:RsiW-degrading membrane proteinase PrsW (M82 family)